jgi:glycosyltransferase involved in cell wall biosynthesis
VNEARTATARNPAWSLVQLVVYATLLVPFGLYNLASALAGLVSRWTAVRPETRTGLGNGALDVVIPYPPGERSGASKAIQNFLAMLSEDFHLTVIPLHELPPPGSRWRRWLSDYLTAALPTPAHCRPFFLSPGSVVARLTPPRTLVIEFVSGGLFLFFRRPRQRVVLRDHEVLVRRLASERREQRGLTRLVTSCRIAVCYLICSVIYRKAQSIIALTPEDAAYLERWFGSAAGKVRFIAQPLDLPSGAGGGDPGTGRDLLFLANFYHRPNVDGLLWFLRHCAPNLPPGFTLHLVGLDEPIRDLELAAPGLTILRHGFVENVDAELPQARIAIAPVTTGGGVRMKNLYLAAHRKAIITTPLGNQGIDFVDGVEAIVRADPAEMAREIAQLADDPGRVTTLGARAYERVAREFNLQAVRRRYRHEVLWAELSIDQESATRSGSTPITGR